MKRSSDPPPPPSAYSGAFPPPRALPVCYLKTSTGHRASVRSHTSNMYKVHLPTHICMNNHMHISNIQSIIYIFVQKRELMQMRANFNDSFVWFLTKNFFQFLKPKNNVFLLAFIFLGSIAQPYFAFVIHLFIFSAHRCLRPYRCCVRCCSPQLRRPCPLPPRPR